MSTVYRAKHIVLNTTSAIKVLQAHLQTDTNAVMRFQQEAKATSGLHHRNIIGVRDFGITPNGQPFIVMDYIQGRSLAEVLAESGPLSVGESVELFSQICEGLQCAHENGVVHRDLKPSNIMLIGNRNHFVVKIVDFGLAKVLTSDLKLTATGDIAGSPQYMSPEQCAGMPQDARSDIYSLGCVMYESLTGAAPFWAETVFEVLRMHMKERPQDFSRELGVPNWLQALVGRMLQKRPQDRIQTVTEILSVLMESSRSFERT